MRTVARAFFPACVASFSLLSVAAAQTLPPARFGHTLTNVGGTLYLFGGTDAAAPSSPGRLSSAGDLLNDLWCYSNQEWNKPEPSGDLPPARHSHAAVAHDELLYIIGGYGASGALDDIWSYDPLSNEWTQGTWTSGTWVAPKRYEHAAVSLGDFIYTYGGRTSSGALTTTGYRYDPLTGDGGQWTAGTGPMSRRGCSAIRVESAIYVFGGYGGISDADYQYRNDVWKWDPASSAWAIRWNGGVGPDGRANAAADGIGARFFILGGDGQGGTTYGDAWEFNAQSGGEGWTAWAALSTPRTRAAAAACGPRAAVFGGWNGQTFLGDLEFIRTFSAYPGDFTGDGTNDVALFRPTTGMWSIRDVTRFYFGSSADAVVPGDYDGDGTGDPAIFRPATGLWSVRDLTRFFFGSSDDVPVASDFRGAGEWDAAIFRPSSSLWSVRDVTRFYFGASGDFPLPGYYRGEVAADAAVFRPAGGLWSIRDLTRLYFGSSGDSPVPGDYRGTGRWDPAIFRPENGLWSIRDVTRFYLGSPDDVPDGGDYRGTGRWDPAIFRPEGGLWSIRGVTRFYFGSAIDIPANR